MLQLLQLLQYMMEVWLAVLVQSFMLFHCSISYGLLLCRTRRTLSYEDGLLPSETGSNKQRAEEEKEDIAVEGRSGLLSVLVPCYNEAECIRATLIGIAECASASSRNETAIEVVLCDAGCSDDTMALIQEFANSDSWLAPLIKTTSSTGGRGPAFEAALAASSGSLILCLHADCVLPPNFDQHIRAGLTKRGVLGTAFRFAVNRNSVSKPVAGLSVMEWTVYLRAWLLQLPFGDQALAITRKKLHDAGDFALDPIMEDWKLVQTMRQAGAAGGGFILTLPVAVQCSGRRWEKMGVWRTNLVNQLTMLWFSQGATPQQIFDFYYGKKTDEVPAWMIKLTQILRN